MSYSATVVGVNRTLIIRILKSNITKEIALAAIAIIIKRKLS